MIPGTGKIQKVVIKNLGPLTKFDDGKPDFLKRFRNQFNTDGIVVGGIMYRNDELSPRKYTLSSGFSRLLIALYASIIPWRSEHAYTAIFITPLQHEFLHKGL